MANWKGISSGTQRSSRNGSPPTNPHVQHSNRLFFYATFLFLLFALTTALGNPASFYLRRGFYKNVDFLFPSGGSRTISTWISMGSSNEVATQFDHEEEDVSEIAIAIMGATGSGKTSFINLVSGSNFDIGKGLQSCTEAVQIAGAFDLDGRRVVLIDTPGFDDTTRSDTDVLKSIAAFLETTYKRGGRLAGVLYFHRISDFRMTGLSRKNFGMFRKLCGDDALQNVVIVTNMWGEVTLKTGNEREAELMREDVFFKPVLEKGAQMARHENTVRSAESIIRRILKNHPLPLRIQEQLVDQHMDISDTDAGEELNREINAHIRRHKAEMHSLEERMERAMKDKDEETRRELEIEKQRTQREIERFQHDSERLESDYKKEKERLEERMRRIELQAREEADRITAQYQRQIDELKHDLRTNTEASERDKAYMRQQISDLSARIATGGRRHRGLLGRIGDAIDSLFS